MLAASLVNTTVDGLPTPSLPNNTGKPDYATIKEIHQLIMANVTLVKSDLSGGQNRYLDLILPPEKYARISDTPLVRPLDLVIKAIFPAWAPPGEENSLL